jgi:DNA-binding CsgD family transcriptional regulator
VVAVATPSSIAQRASKACSELCGDSVVGAGDLVQASALAQEIVGFPPGAMRDAALGYLAIVRGRSSEADTLLGSAWGLCEPAEDPRVAATIAQRRALHGIGRLDGEQVVQWAGRAVELAEPGEPARAEAQAVLGLGHGWLGRMSDGFAVQESALAALPPTNGSALPSRIRMAHGWLQLVSDDLAGARSELVETAPAALRLGSIRIALWAPAWLARTDFLVGAWDEAILNAERAVSLLEESGHEWLRPLVRWTAGMVPTARGDWPAAEEQVRLASAQSGDYELMVVAAGLARAQLAAAHGDHGATIRAIEPLLEIEPRQAVDEPGFWPWQDLYGEALVGAGRTDEADAFLAPHEALAADRDRHVAMARLARVRGRIEAARGHGPEAEAAFGTRPRADQAAATAVRVGSARAGPRPGAPAARPPPGRRGPAAGRPRAAGRSRGPPVHAAVRAGAARLRPGPRGAPHFDPSQLTPQELAVARLVADGLINQRIASELFVSVKTVQFHLTHIYAKLGVSSRGELVARLKDDMAEASPSPDSG